MNYYALGMPQNYTKAVEWFQAAANQGNARAQYSLGIMYENGEGVPQNTEEAIKWFKKAAEQGYENAQISLREYGL